MKLKIYMKSSRVAVEYEVKNFFTEGNLLRLIKVDGTNEWFPLCEVYRIIQLA